MNKMVVCTPSNAGCEKTEPILELVVRFLEDLTEENTLILDELKLFLFFLEANDELIW